MVRKALDIVLAVTATLFLVLGGISYFVPLFYGLPVTDTDWAILHFFDGRVRTFWIYTEGEPITVTQSDRGSMPTVLIRQKDGLEDRADGSRAFPRNSYWISAIRIGGREDVGAFGGRWRWNLAARTYPGQRGAVSPVFTSYARLPVWLVAVVMLISPTSAVVRGPMLQRHRRKRGLCIRCGYDLRALPEPRCPECGTPI